MASSTHLFFFFSLFLTVRLSKAQPYNGKFTCSDHSIRSCDSYLYHPSPLNPDSKNQVASIYSVSNSSVELEPIHKQGYLVSVPCSCRENPRGNYYSYDTFYTVEDNSTDNLVPGIGHPLIAGETIGIELPCGCSEDDSVDILTYTVQRNETLTSIAELLSVKEIDIVGLNGGLSEEQRWSIVVEKRLLFVPRKKRGTKQGRHTTYYVGITFGVVSGISLLLFVSFSIRKRKLLAPADHKQQESTSTAEDIEACRSTSRLSLLTYFQKHDFQDVILESEGPRVYTVKEINHGTNGFDESRIIGEGGYGKVYFGILGGKEVAIKRMKSSSLHEFVAELKALCKVNHVNVVELLGYASEENFLYLVYEYLPNGSLSDHLHNPLFRGHAPLSWTARAQIALDAAKGIEYIHDHTKAQYVHRDIKTSNILLDRALRAKVADFGLTMLMERTNEEESLVETPLIGTMGYMAPESVRELQITTKSDVFAFGVVLAELVTAQNAVVIDRLEPTRIKSLAITITKIFRDRHPEMALETNIDSNLRRSSPLQEVHKMAELSRWCLSEEPLSRPEMGDVVQILTQIVISSVEWEASLGGSSQVFSGLDIGR
ncbi:LysM domain receptor-like kinase 3 [Linum grandiflorum]